MLDLSRKHDRATELRAIADGRLLLNVRNGVTVSRSMLAKIADELEAERAAHAETQRERDEAIKAAGDQATLRGEAEGKLAASEMAGIVDGWKRRAEAYRTQLDEALKALEPFAQHLDEMKFDLDNNGNPLPDDQAVGWVYVTNGDFRAARRVREGDQK